MVGGPQGGMGGLRHAPKPAPAGGPPSERCRGGNLPPGGFGYDDSRSIAPPISLLPCQKRNGPYPQGVCRIRKAAEPPTAARLRGPKRKTLCRAPVQWPSARTGVSRVGAGKTSGLLPARAGPLIFPGLDPRIRCGGRLGGKSAWPPASVPVAASWSREGPFQRADTQVRPYGR